jgi:hypothetical protein
MSKAVRSEATENETRKPDMTRDESTEGDSQSVVYLDRIVGNV